MKRVLHIISSLSVGGIESFVVQLLDKIDHNKYEVHVAVFNPIDPIHQKTLENIGVRVHFISIAGINSKIYTKIFWRFLALYNYIKLINKYKFDVIHCHNFLNYHFYVLLAYIFKVPIRIVHCHTAGSKGEGKLSYILRRFKNLVLFESLITHRIGCSNQSTKWFFGNNSLNNGYAQTIYNGVNRDVFSKKIYQDKSDILYAKYKIKHNNFNLLHVGRFSEVKNQIFLINIVNELRKKDKNIHLHIVGSGPLESALKNKVSDLNLWEYISFYDSKTNIPELMSIMNLFLLPSYWEGFPVTAIEAQFMELPIFLSDTITKEVDCGLSTFIPIDSGKKWIEKILYFKNSTSNNHMNIKEMNEFDIKNIVKKIEKVYDQ